MEDNEFFGPESSDYPEEFPTSKPIIKVIGVGGGGVNVVTEMFHQNLKDVDLMICNTDVQSLELSPVAEKIKLGGNLAKGLGAGCDPERGKLAAEASIPAIKDSLSGNTEMVFITACMGGGTGTGAAPVIARVAKEMGKLTVAVVTIPFRDEGKEEVNRAMQGVKKLQKEVDSLLIIDNQKIYKVFGDLAMSKAFKKANEVLVIAVKSISEFITKPGFINVDFADVKMVMQNGGMAIMGIGEAEGTDRAQEAVKQAFESPLLNDCDLSTCKGVLMYVCCSDDVVKMSELNQAVQHVASYTGNASKFKRGIINDKSMGEKISVTIVATGFDVQNLPEIEAANPNIHVVDREGDEKKGMDVGETKKTVVSNPKNPYTGKEVEIGEGTMAMPYTRKYAKGERPALIVDDDSDILRLENEPAYMRKGKKNEIKKNVEEFDSQGYVLKHIDGRNILSTDNSFLHKTQD